MAGAGVTISVRVDGVDTADGPANSTRDGHHRPADVPRPPDVPSYARPRQNVRRTNCNVRRTGGPIPHATATPVRRTFRVRRTFPPTRVRARTSAGRSPSRSFFLHQFSNKFPQLPTENYIFARFLHS